MANELVHGSVGTELTQAEWEGVGTHVFNSQATGDIVYASSSSQLSRLAKGTDTHVLILSSGIPAWSASTGITAVGTIATGTWQGTNVGVAYGGTGVSTLTDNAVLTGTGASAITAEANLTFDGSTLTVQAGYLDVKRAGYSGISSQAYSTTPAEAAFLNLERSNHGTLVTHAAVDDNDVLGYVSFRGSDGDSFESGAQIKGMATETWSGSAMGTELLFYTTANTTHTSLVERMRIHSTGEIDLKSNALGLTNVGASGNDWTATNLSVNSANDGGYNTLYVNNSSTAADSRARLVLQAPATSGASDPYIYFAVTSGEDWVAGIDNSNDDKWVLAASDSLGTSDVLRLDGRTTGVSSVTRLELANLSSTLTNSASAEMIQFDIDNADTTITGATTITTHQPLGMRIQAQRMSSSSTVTVNDASHLLIQGVPSPDTNVTFTNSTGLMIQNDTHGGTVTNQYGIRLAAQTGGGITNVGIDMGNNTLENVGASGNDFKAATLDLASTFTIQGAGRLNISTGTSFLAIQSDDGGGLANKALFGVYGLRMAGNTAHATTEGTNIISLFNGTAPAGTLANGASFFCASGEMKVIDAAGNITVLSPHDDDGEWVFHSQDDAGKVIHIQMERLMKRLDEMLGGGFIEEYTELGV